MRCSNDRNPSALELHLTHAANDRRPQCPALAFKTSPALFGKVGQTRLVLSLLRPRPRFLPVALGILPTLLAHRDRRIDHAQRLRRLFLAGPPTPLLGLVNTPP